MPTSYVPPTSAQLKGEEPGVDSYETFVVDSYEMVQGRKPNELKKIKGKSATCTQSLRTKGKRTMKERTHKEANQIGLRSGTNLMRRGGRRRREVKYGVMNPWGGGEGPSREWRRMMEKDCPDVREKEMQTKEREAKRKSKEKEKRGN